MYIYVYVHIMYRSISSAVGLTYGKLYRGPNHVSYSQHRGDWVLVNDGHRLLYRASIKDPTKVRTKHPGPVGLPEILTVAHIWQAPKSRSTAGDERWYLEPPTASTYELPRIMKVAGPQGRSEDGRGILCTDLKTAPTKVLVQTSTTQCTSVKSLVLRVW